MTRKCANCESFISSDYARVFAVDGVVYACPNCEDRTRGPDGRARAKKSGVEK